METASGTKHQSMKSLTSGSFTTKIINDEISLLGSLKGFIIEPAYTAQKLLTKSFPPYAAVCYMVFLLVLFGPFLLEYSRSGTSSMKPEIMFVGLNKHLAF
jgi:hypothetical protein